MNQNLHDSWTDWGEWDIALIFNVIAIAIVLGTFAAFEFFLSFAIFHFILSS